MSDSLLRPDNASSVPGGITAADPITDTATPGAGAHHGDPTSNDSAPANPTVTGPGATGQTPSGGQKAVPDDAALAQSGVVGDTSGFGDSGAPHAGLSAGDTGSDTPVPGSTNAGQGQHVAISDLDTDKSEDGGVPTGGLAAGVKGA